jgi:hypothetical protein
MQPTVIPFELTPKWFLITVFLLMAAMFVIHQLMMRWSSLRNVFAHCMKLKKMAEEEANRGVRNEYHDEDAIPDVSPYRAASDIESLGMRALPRRIDPS